MASAAGMALESLVKATDANAILRLALTWFAPPGE